MKDYLVFTLYGPLQAWGTIAVGEVRPVASHPTRSGVLGLLAAALGIRRDEEERLAALHESCGFAVRVDAPGERILDYHTVQMPRARKNRVFYSRRDELGPMLDPDEDLNTILSSREYLADACFTACVWFDNEGEFSLEDIAEHLNQPDYTLYLGRKSCPVAAPLSPSVVSAESVPEALGAYDCACRNTFDTRTFLKGLQFADRPFIYSDEKHNAKKYYERFTVNDRVLHHGRRQFGPRSEYRLESLEVELGSDAPEGTDT